MKKYFLLLVLLVVTGCTGANTANLPAEQNADFASVTDILPAIVRLGLLNDGYIATGSCSGTIVDPRGVILTNYHCIGDTQSGILHNPEGLVEVYITKDYASPPVLTYYAQRVAADRSADVAVLQIVRLADGTAPTDCLALTAATVNPSPVAIEADVRAVGYPGYGGETLTVTAGKVAGIKGFGEASADRPGEHVAIKITAAVGHGNSGGALVNAKNELIGIPFYLYPDEQGSTGQMYYAVAVSEATDLLAAATRRPIPGCDGTPAASLIRDVAAFPPAAVYGKLSYRPQSGQPFDMAAATVYLFDPNHDVRNLTLADIQTALARATTSTDGTFAVALTRDQYEHALGVVIVYQDRIVVRENNVILADQTSPLREYEKQHVFVTGTDSISVHSFYSALSH